MSFSVLNLLSHNSPCILLATLLAFLGYLFHFIGIVTNSWNNFSGTEVRGNDRYFLIRVGLWKACVYDSGTEVCSPFSANSGVVTVRLFEVLAQMLYFAQAVLLILYLKKGITKQLIQATIVGFIVGILTAISYLTWITQVGTIYQYNLSYSFNLTIVSFCLEIASVLLLSIEIRAVVGQEDKLQAKDRVDTEMSFI